MLNVLSSGGLSPAGTELCSSHVAFAYPGEFAGPGALEGHFCSFFAIFRIFGVLLGLLKSTWLFKLIFFGFPLILEGFLEDFGRVWGGFFDDFLNFSWKRRFCKI